MSSPNSFPNGLNLTGTVFQNGPDTLQLGGAVYLSGLIQWLDTIGGNNANAGNKPELPVKTLAQAVTNSAENGVIVIGEGSSESISAAQNINLNGLSIFGCGVGSTRPRYTAADSGDPAMLVLSDGVWIEGIYFPASSVVPSSRVSMSGDRGTMRNCYFECGVNDSVGAVVISAPGCTVKGCSFVVTALRPAIGLEVGAAVADTLIEGCTFDGGSYGWTDYALKVSDAAIRVRNIGNTFINQSDVGHTVTGTTYQIFGAEVGGTGNVLLTA